MLLAAAIFGGQAIAENQEDADVQRALAEVLPSASTGAVEVANLQRTQGGYGICGAYRVKGSDKGYASFFYDTVNRKVVLDVKSREYTYNCGLSAFC